MSKNRKKKPEIDNVSEPDDIGSYLKKVRLENNLSIEQLAGHTKIRPENIHAIENNEGISHIPNAYFRGYIKCYCLFFGLDATAVLSKLPTEEYAIPKSSYSPVNSFQVKRATEHRDDKTTISPRKNWTKLISAAVICGLAATAGFQQYQRSQESAYIDTNSGTAVDQGHIGSIIDIS